MFTCSKKIKNNLFIRDSFRGQLATAKAESLNC